MKIAIAGGGIGGLTAALCLHEKGFDVTVYEAVPDIKPLGVGINLLPHGAAILHGLGLGAELDALAVRTRAIEYRTKFGQLIQSDARGVEAGFDYPQYSIHRGQLLILLLNTVRQRLGDNAVVTNRAFERFEQTGDTVKLHFANGTSASSNLLIGADGFHSKVRKQLHPNEGPAHFEGMMMWRGANEQAPFGDGRTMFIAGNHTIKLVCYPISEAARTRGKSLVNWVAEVRSEQPRTAQDADWTREGKRDFINAFRDFTMPDIDVIKLLESTAEITEYPMIDRDPLPWWTSDRVTLLGDAAHPMYPIGANGAGQAILDGHALAKALAQNPDPKALQIYEADRREKTTKVVLSNRESGPERVLDIADERLKDATGNVEDLISSSELEAVASNYRSIAGFERGGKSPKP